MKIVQFPDGNYAIQKGIVFKRYVSLSCKEVCWKPGEFYFNECLTKDANKIKTIFDYFTNNVKSISKEEL